ncbi:PH, RCC1 and FYVE domains-containing protein 1-like isoform X2 [Zingiber officinale]|uniref:PH, RCC1 and FYVE domains-containing protein 1-like isoform X2 n=1 Tax=Zingiber officinale TaxID=94328 RepID=UPI001C4D2BF6|nr:PH, RCC1 and FYVE domains-containing protein 1-like isoform X2 [Zingiber officinale]
MDDARKRERIDSGGYGILMEWQISLASRILIETSIRKSQHDWSCHLCGMTMSTLAQKMKKRNIFLYLRFLSLIALKKGAQLLKYGRKGKPKFYPFRLSSDESALIWLSSSGEKYLKLASVSRIVPGQRTPVFQRHLRPDKDYLSFSLIYKDGKRSLDLICKDKVEAEVWFSGLKALISIGQYGRSKIDGWNNGGFCSEDGRESASNSISDQSVSSTYNSSEGRLTSSNIQNNLSCDYSAPSETSDVTNMHAKGVPSDGFRISVSSVPSTSSHGSAQDDFDAAGDVYVWGEVICDSSTRISADKSSNPSGARTDILLPKPIESNVVLDAHHVACGVRHVALVTRQGELFTWGEESGGRLGHGVGTDIIHPRLLESLSTFNVDYVACGEFHTCAITAAGELYTWGDGTHNAGLLGHGTNVCHWVPKRVSFPLEGLHVSHVSCGVWHTAIITTTGQLFTFGDGTFGVLGHGDRQTLLFPREVESLVGLKTIDVSCGVWHTAAIVEVMVTQSSASSGKLFTWGDGDKYRLGHGDKVARLKPTCVPSLIDYNFHRLGCGHSLTIGLTTSGQLFTMGSTVYGQLGNPRSDGKYPCLVEDKLAVEPVAEVACGSYHVAVLTSKGEVYTWGKGANGRLGHGDFEDRKLPTLVEALKDRLVKHVSCGSNFTTVICQHKWVSGAEQSLCSACRQPFGFTRKKHNCYNCGLVHCHQCSSKKALRAALSPNPGKPYRVCDSCYVKLTSGLEMGGVNNKKTTKVWLPTDGKDKYDKAETLSKGSLSNNLDLIKNMDTKTAKIGMTFNAFSIVQTPKISSVSPLKTIAFPVGIDILQTVSKPVQTSVAKSANLSRAVSPFSRKPTPPRSTTPTPTTSGLSFSKTVSDSLKKTNDLLNHELLKSRAEVESLRQRGERQDFELQKAEKKLKDAMALVAEESAKSKAAKEVIKSLTAQLKEMAERLPHGIHDSMTMKSLDLSKSDESLYIQHATSAEELNTNDVSNGPSVVASKSVFPGQRSGQGELRAPIVRSENTENRQNPAPRSNDTASAFRETATPRGNDAAPAFRETVTPRGNDAPAAFRSSSTASVDVEAEWIEQFEPGVYITLVTLRDGTRDLKRVRFSRRKFGEQQAETWWAENRERVYERYNLRIPDRASSTILT